MGHWEARATYEDGFEIEKSFPYTANGNYFKACEEQYDIECWLATFVNEHGVWTFYTVDYVSE